MSYPQVPEPEDKLPEDIDLTDITDLSQIPEITHSEDNQDAIITIKK